MTKVEAWKGFEREVAKTFRKVWPDARRSSQAHHRGDKRHGRHVPDIDETPYWVECTWKESEPPSLNQFLGLVRKKWDQAVRDKELSGDIRSILVCIGICRGPRLVFFERPEAVIECYRLDSDELQQELRSRHGQESRILETTNVQRNPEPSCGADHG